MAVYGVGAYYDKDVSSDFINQNLVGVGWSATDASESQEYFRSLKAGKRIAQKLISGIIATTIGLASRLITGMLAMAKKQNKYHNHGKRKSALIAV